MQNASIENMILVIISNIINVDTCRLEQLTFCQVIAGTGDTVVIERSLTQEAPPEPVLDSWNENILCIFSISEGGWRTIRKTGNTKRFSNLQAFQLVDIIDD